MTWPASRRIAEALASRPRAVVAAITIGSAPRPDLTDGLRAALAGTADVAESGALDGTSPGVIPPAIGGAGRPLVTTAADGRAVVVDEGWLAPRVQALVGRAEADGVAAIVLLCAGGFDEVSSAAVPLVRPRDAALARLRDLRARRILVLVPIEGQVGPAAAAWSADGFEPVVDVGGPAEVTGDRLAAVSPDAVVLDFVGHPRTAVEAAAAAIAPIPLVDLSAEMVAAAVATMRR